MNFLRTEQTGKIPKVVIQGGGIRCENMPLLISSYIEKDLTFNTPGHNYTIQSGRYVNPDSNPTFTLFLKEKEKYWIPRGYVFFLLRNLRKSKYKVEIVDKTLTLKMKDEFNFLGILRDYQEKAKKDIIRYPLGILHANTGSGKTIIACSVIACRQQPTLIIVHSKELLYQWQDRIKDFLGVQCGLIGDGNYSIAPITVGIINSVVIHIKKLTKLFGQVINDECHKVGSVNWVYTLQEFHAKYFLGLTATPYRSDGLSGVMYAAIGPKIHTIKIDDEGFVLKPDVYRIQTNFKYLYVGDHSDMLNAMMENTERNKLICSDINSDLKKYNENILVISDRKKHLDNLSKIILSEYNLKNTILTGSTKDKIRTETVKNVRAGKIKILLATTPLIMEGFDIPNLTALFMATPLKFKGRVIQACGRILRPSKESPNKIPRIYDYRDNWVRNLRNAGLKRDRMYMIEWGKKTK